MKKLIIAGMLLISALSFSQKRDIDSVQIYNPDTTKYTKVRKTLKSIDNLAKTLDSLSIAEKQDLYYVRYFLKDGRVIQCRVRKIKLEN